MELFSDPIALTIIGSDDHVLYGCQCEEMKPVTKLYFCRHCTKLRCSKCVTHEVREKLQVLLYKTTHVITELMFKLLTY